MVYNLGYKKSVSRDLKQLSKSAAKLILDKIDQELLRDPKSNPPLKGHFAGLRKYRVGEYRVIYALIETEIRILRIGHRKEVYRNLLTIS